MCVSSVIRCRPLSPIIMYELCVLPAMDIGYVCKHRDLQQGGHVTLIEHNESIKIQKSKRNDSLPVASCKSHG